MFEYIFSGLLGVSNMILWGVYGDLLVEEFDIKKVLRSILIGILWSIFLFIINPKLPLFIVALVTISLERITTEIYKAFIRVEDQSKYKIPSDLNLKLDQKVKIVVGTISILLLSLFLYSVEINVSKIYLILFIGLFIALGGMLKDAPYEGFDLRKFVRSPLIVSVVGVFLLFFFSSIPGKYFLLSIGGGERIISEFYKKILRGKIPGKFKQTKLNERWKIKRKWLLPLYAINILGLTVLALN